MCPKEAFSGGLLQFQKNFCYNSDVFLKFAKKKRKRYLYSQFHVKMGTRVTVQQVRALAALTIIKLEHEKMVSRSLGKEGNLWIG